MRLICTGISDTGMARDHNEDNFYLSTAGDPLVVVADGMGGHRSGEVASELACTTIDRYYRDTILDDIDETAFKSPFSWPFKRKKPEDNDEQRLVQGLLEANRAIFDQANSDEAYRGMGTTIVAAFFVEDGMYVAHIGDSRCYRFRNGQLELLTEDHSLANEYVRMGILAPEDIENFPYKNVVTRACGLAPEVEVEVNFEEIEDGDVYLLCSDGLTDCVNDHTIEQLLSEYPELDDASVHLVDAANDGGGTDNITVVLAQTILD